MEGGQPKTFSAKQQVRLSTTLCLPTGNLRLRNVEYLVFEEYMPEVLLSRPVLMSLGFNLDAHLANVRESYHNADFSGIGFDPAIVESAKTDGVLNPGNLSSILLNNDTQNTESLPH